VIRGLLEWLGNTPWSIRLVESYYVWPVIETSHVLTIAFFVGTAMMMDLRLLGVSFGGVPVSEFTGRMLRWTRAGFVLMVVTGLLIFYSAPIRYYHNVFFRMKMLLLVLAGLNIWFFHARIHRRIAEWDHDASPPRAARLAGALSITFWLLIVAFGRMIAYNWFDCGLQPQPSWVNRLAACVLPTE
jgi:hypothetical protein